MLKLYTWITDLLRREEGQDVIEYALISALISVGIISVVILTGMVGAFGTWANAVKAAMSTAFPALVPG